MEIIVVCFLLSVYGRLPYQLEGTAQTISSCILFFYLCRIMYSVKITLSIFFSCHASTICHHLLVRHASITCKLCLFQDPDTSWAFPYQGIHLFINMDKSFIMLYIHIVAIQKKRLFPSRTKERRNLSPHIHVLLLTPVKLVDSSRLPNCWKTMACAVSLQTRFMPWLHRAKTQVQLRRSTL